MCLRESGVPIELATSYVHSTALSLLEAENHRGLVLDAAAGEGALTLTLMKRGYSVVPVDINPSNLYQD
jgi:2-polyprenyl-3-methyl-5-hydroxy-6-metoxy-1,4-benzoquinol methylase